MFYFSQRGFIFIMWQPDKVSINVWMDVSHVGLRGVFEYEESENARVHLPRGT